jgi:hypothetical protein
VLRDLIQGPMLLLSASVTLLGGCAGQGHFPSLLPRPIEKLGTGDAAPEAPPAPAIPQDPALGRQLSQLLDRARAGQQAFEKDYGAAEAAVARAGGSGSETWVAAQVLVSRLEGARADTTAALADLDALVLTRASEGKAMNEADRAAIASTRDQVQALADGQAEKIAGLSERLSR